MNSMSLTTYLSDLSELLTSTLVTNRYGKSISSDCGANNWVDMIVTVKNFNKKVIVIGNGGSEAIASHVHNDLCKAVGVRAMVFSDPSLMTALSNDIGYEVIYKQPLEMWAEGGDMLIAVSSSGMSANILSAVETARQSGCKIVTLSGFDEDNELRKMGDLNFYVPSHSYGYVESAHAVLAHFVTDCAAATQKKESEETVCFKLLKISA